MYVSQLQVSAHLVLLALERFFFFASYDRSCTTDDTAHELLISWIMIQYCKRGRILCRKVLTAPDNSTSRSSEF